MRASNSARWGWSLWTVFVCAAFAGVVFLGLNGWEGATHPATEGALLFALTAFATVGAVVVSRRPDNAIGWLFLALALITAVGNLGSHYARYALVTRPGELPAGEVAAWVSHWTFGLGVEMILFVLLLFPTGRVPSARWRPLLWITAATLAAFALDSAFRPGPLVELGFPLENPLGLPGTARLFEALNVVANVLLQVVALSAIASLIVRARRSRGDERQQLKWFGYAAAFMMASSFGATALVTAVLPDAAALQNLPFVVGIALLPIAAGVAILRYRLYDIDLIINRTLVYVALTAVLALVYFGGVVGVGGAVRSLAPEARSDSLVVAASTLAVAALFRPVRARIQSFIDRRFYRARYDAVRTLEAFSASLRNEVDIDAMRAHLLATVHETMQPRRVSLWLRT